MQGKRELDYSQIDQEYCSAAYGGVGILQSVKRQICFSGLLDFVWDTKMDTNGRILCIHLLEVWICGLEARPGLSSGRQQGIGMGP